MEEAKKKTDEEIEAMWNNLTPEELQRALKNDKRWFWLYLTKKTEKWKQRGYNDKQCAWRTKIILIMWGAPVVIYYLIKWLITKQLFMTLCTGFLTAAFIQNIIEPQFGIFEMFVSCFIMFCAAILVKSFWDKVIGPGFYIKSGRNGRAEIYLKDKETAAESLNGTTITMMGRLEHMFGDYRLDALGKLKEPNLK